MPPAAGATRKPGAKLGRSALLATKSIPLQICLVLLSLPWWCIICLVGELRQQLRVMHCMLRLFLPAWDTLCMLLVLAWVQLTGGSPHVMLLAADKGWNLVLRRVSKSVNVSDRFAMSALLRAAQNGHAAAVQTL